MHSIPCICNDEGSEAKGTTDFDADPFIIEGLDNDPTTHRDIDNGQSVRILLTSTITAAQRRLCLQGSRLKREQLKEALLAYRTCREQRRRSGTSVKLGSMCSKSLLLAVSLDEIK